MKEANGTLDGEGVERGTSAGSVRAEPTISREDRAAEWRLSRRSATTESTSVGRHRASLRRRSGALCRAVV